MGAGPWCEARIQQTPISGFIRWDWGGFSVGVGGRQGTVCFWIQAAKDQKVKNLGLHKLEEQGVTVSTGTGDEEKSESSWGLVKCLVFIHEMALSRSFWPIETAVLSGSTPHTVSKCPDKMILVHKTVVIFSLPFEKVTAVTEGEGSFKMCVSQEPKCLSGE